LKADYDSQADALSIDLLEVDRWDEGEGIDEDFCTVSLSQGRPVNVELLSPESNLALLELAAKRFDLDQAALAAAAHAALAAPDRVVTLDVAAPAAA
jgi:hypothetical protein